jgi:flavodoxin
MKTLVVYYSRTGTTKKAAEDLAAELKCDIEEVFDAKDRNGAMGFIMAGKDATMKALTKLKETKSDPSRYELVVVGTPVWAGNVSTPIRTYLGANKASLRKVAFFCTQGRTGSEDAFREMASLCAINPLATLALASSEAGKDASRVKVREFAAKIR